MFMNITLEICFILLALCSLLQGASITQSLIAGVCLCVSEPNVEALSDPADPKSIIGYIYNGACFVTHGSVFHKNGITYYHLRDTSNLQTAWIDSFYLLIERPDKCNGLSVVQQQVYHTPTGSTYNCTIYGMTYTHGQHFQQHGLHCTCDDGGIVCSQTGLNCFEDGIVYQHGTTFNISVRGTCACSQGSLSCIVGK